MSKKLYVGNLPFRTNDAELRELFERFGPVSSSQVIMDRDTGRSRGFGFVEMDNENEADEAIRSLHGNDFDGRPLTVNEARERMRR